MASLKKAQCTQCAKQGDQREKNIVYGWQHRNNPRRDTLCASHNAIRKRNDARVKKAEKSLHEKDWDLNMEIWNTRPHVCVECGKPLDEHVKGERPPKHYFSHLMGKGAHPELRYDPNNIVLHHLRCHQLWEFGDRYKSETWEKNRHWMQNNGYKPV